MNKVSAVILAATFGLAGWAAPSFGADNSGGYYPNNRVNDRLVKLVFASNGAITDGNIQMYALYRCAQFAKEAKKPYFVLYNSLVAAAQDTPTMQPRLNTLAGRTRAMAFIALEDKPRPGAQEVSSILTKLAPMAQFDLDAGKTKP